MFGIRMKDNPPADIIPDGEEKEAEEQKEEIGPKSYEYIWQVRFSDQAGGMVKFSSTNSSREEAEKERKLVIENLSTALKTKDRVMADVNIGINGEDITWFWVDDVNEV